MPNSFVRSFRRSVIGGVALAGLIPALAMAQEAPSGDEDAAVAKEEIVVTGTLVRGIAPPGANVIGVTSAAIEETGSTNVAQLLQTIPQLGSFGSLQQPLAINNVVSVNRPNLRSLPGFNTSGGSSTLVLMDGHRIVGMGVASTGPDPDVIPPGVIERLEIVPDGGSAIYGSDAVAGVLNFITIKRFDGVKVDASYGFADSYYEWDANVTAGKDWGSGSAFISYNYAKTDGIVGRDRDYVRQFPNAAGNLNLSCGAGNVEGLPSGPVVGLPNVALARVPYQCDSSDLATVYPASRRHSVFAGLTQQLDDSLSVDLRAFYTNRRTEVLNGPFRTSRLISSLPQFVDSSAVRSPFSAAGDPLFNAGNALAFAQNVYFQFGTDDASRSTISLDTWGVSANFTKDLGGSFRLRVLGNYGESTTSLISTAFNSKGLTSAIRTGLINPYNLTDPLAPNAAQALSILSNWESYNQSRQRLYNARAIVDGDLFSLPGGGVKIAAGLEFSHEVFGGQYGETVPGFENQAVGPISLAGTPLIFGNAASFGAPIGALTGIAAIPRFNVDRTVKSVFGELVVPIFGNDNATPGFDSLTLSIAGRYDNYSDFGDTFNPRFGATWKPVDWVSIHGAWGKSFNAPSLADAPAAGQRILQILTGNAASFFKTGAPDAVPTGNIIALQGNAPGISPQKATTWTLGIDVQPPFVPGLNLGLTYYNIDFRGYIGFPPFESPPSLYADYTAFITFIRQDPTKQAILDAAFAASDVRSDGSTTAPLAANTYAYFDARKQNIGDVKVSGLDFSASYRTDTGFGAVFLNANGTYSLSSKLRVTGSTAPYVERIDTGISRLRLRATAGVDVGPVTAQLTWSHLQGYALRTPAVALGYPNQTRVGAFNTFDLFLRYAMKGEGLGKDLALTLNVNNLFDQDPPEFRGGASVAGSNGYANGATLGRLVKFGVSKKF